MEPWRSAITSIEDGCIRIRGYESTELMARATFADIVFLLSAGRLPTAAERRLTDAILIAAADHGAGTPSAAAARMVASGNRRSFEAAVAAGMLAIGDAHGGAGEGCMEVIHAGLERAAREAIPIPEAADRAVAETVEAGMRLPGLGHRTHSEDPRAVSLLSMARESGLAGDGVAFLSALADAARRRIRPLPINVDGAIAAVLYDLGLSPSLAKALFLIGRAAGLTAHVLEEHTREKPMRIQVDVRYDGVAPRGMGE